MQSLAYKPKLILADEPVLMLDVSIRIGLLNVMAKPDDDFIVPAHEVSST